MHAFATDDAKARTVCTAMLIATFVFLAYTAASKRLTCSNDIAKHERNYGSSYWPYSTRNKVYLHLVGLDGRRQLALASFKWKSPRRTRTFFPPQFSKIPALWPTGSGEPSNFGP